MVVKTAFDHQANDSEIDKVVGTGIESARRDIAQVLSQAQQAGELSPTADVNALANYLFSVANGLSALAQSEQNFSELEKTLGVVEKSPALSKGLQLTPFLIIWSKTRNFENDPN